MEAFNSTLHRAVNIQMNKEDFVAKWNFIFETAYLNGKLQEKHLEKWHIKQHTSLQLIEIEAEKFASLAFFPKVTNKLANIFWKQTLEIIWGILPTSKILLTTTRISTFFATETHLNREMELKKKTANFFSQILKTKKIPKDPRPNDPRSNQARIHGEGNE
jgi:hypothetical protein